MKIITSMLKVSKKNVVVFNYRVNFNYFVVADVIFFAEFLETLNCFAVKRVRQKISDEKKLQISEGPKDSFGECLRQRK